jgi:surface polysaccharide O-acyltransferase-like enzyme
LDPKGGEISLPVDLIRTVAIVLVILLHAANEPHQFVDIMAPDAIVSWWASNIYNSLARPCVPLFIMLAGALLLQPSKVNEPLRVFFKKRLSRIGLPFIFWGVAYFAWRFYVNGEALSMGSILQGVLTGPYMHFWFLYLIVGLYLITPVLRVIVTHSDRRLLKYFLSVWFVGTAIVPLLILFGPYSLSADVFLITGWLGYFILGWYLLKIRLRPLILYLVLVLGFVCTIFATFFVIASIGERFSQFFYDSFSANVIAASVALFLLLSTVQPDKVASRFPRVNRLLHTVSQNTLPIYLFHVMVMEALQRGYLGFTLSITTVNPVLEIPLITAVTLFICLGVIIPLKKIPLLKKLIG